MNVLKPCPFCGNDDCIVIAELDTIVAFPAWWGRAICTQCGAKSDSHIGYSEDAAKLKAVVDWNGSAYHG